MHHKRMQNNITGAQLDHKEMENSSIKLKIIKMMQSDHKNDEKKKKD